MQKWMYYNHAIVSRTAPHEKANIAAILDKSVWKLSGFSYRKYPLFAKYTTNFDCETKTEWWFLIKDDELKIEELKANKRYEIRKGLKNCYARKINVENYYKELYYIYKNAMLNYSMPGKMIDEETFISYTKLGVNIEYWGVFSKENQRLLGYCHCNVYKDYVEFSTIKLDPDHLKLNTSFALIYEMTVYYINHHKKKYISDGERSIKHMTNFQEFLEKYFGFRKAYCQLNIVYRPLINIIIKILYPFRFIIKRLDINNYTHNVIGILEIERIRRSFINGK